MSLIRLHMEKMRPPRALWVPFELGRPFGPPGDAAFQTRVLRMALSLLEAPAGPVLEDFPDEMPESETATEVWACPVSLARPPAEAGENSLVEELRQEIARLRVWYELGIERRGRTTVGASTLEVDAVVELLSAASARELPPSPVPDLDLSDVLRLAAEDLKAFYLEAATAQPGAPRSSRGLTDWFWQETSGGAVLRAVQARLRHADEDLRYLGEMLLVPQAVEEA